MYGAALKNSLETSKHGQLIGWFNKEYISSKKADPKFGKIQRSAFQNRTKGDCNEILIYIQFTLFPGKICPPIIQGGMGVRFSGANLASAVANEGCAGANAYRCTEIVPVKKLVDQLKEELIQNL